MPPQDILCCIDFVAPLRYVQVAGVLMFMCQLLLSGLFPPAASVRGGWMWLSNIVGVSWVVRFIVIIQVSTP